MNISKYIWLFIMSFNITVIHAQKVSNSILKNNSLQCVQIFPLGENKASFLNVYQDTINNYVMFSTIRCYGKNFSEIGTISGAGNIDFEKGKISLKSISLSREDNGSSLLLSRREIALLRTS